MRRATKLHCCSANRLVLVDGSTRCEVCLSAEAARRLFGNSIPPAGPKEQREQEETRETEGKNSKQLFLSLRPPHHHLLFLLLSLWQGGKFGWRASERKKESEGGRKGVSWRASAEVVVQRLSASKCLTYNILDAEEIISSAKD